MLFSLEILAYFAICKFEVKYSFWLIDWWPYQVFTFNLCIVATGNLLRFQWQIVGLWRHWLQSAGDDVVITGGEESYRGNTVI